MERRFELRKQQLLEDAELKSELSKGMLNRLSVFVEPFAACLGRREMMENAQQYVSGLLSDLERKNVESIAYRHDRDRRALQRFIGIAPWDFRPPEQELVRQVGQSLGQDDGVIVFDPSGIRSVVMNLLEFNVNGSVGWARLKTARSESIWVM